MTFGHRPKQREKEVLDQALFIKKKNGKAYIVTNHHVVEGAQEIEMTFDDGTKAEGRLIGGDIWTDFGGY